MGVATHVIEGLRPLVDLIYPPRCPICGEAIAAQGGLCTDCWSELIIPGEPSCAICQRPFGAASVTQGALCAPCLSEPPRHNGISAATLYNDASRKLVLSFKHGRRLGLAPLLGNLLAARVPDVLPETLFVPVPLHRWRLWQRGFNQAAMLAGVLAKRKRGTLAVDVLRRRKATRPLGGLGRKDRVKLLKDAIEITPAWRARIKGVDIVLVDDVLTSGATTDACVRVLKQAGAATVRIACFARVMDEAIGVQTRRDLPLQNITPEV